MEAIVRKLKQLLTTKNQIRSAITAKGVDVPMDTPFRGYPEKIRKIKTGSHVLSARGYVLPKGTATITYDLAMAVRVAGQATT